MSKDDKKNDGRLAFGDYPFPHKKIGITISGLQQWVDGVATGATVRVDVLQSGKSIHTEVFSGQSAFGFTRTVSVPASSDDLVTVHNRPDLPGLKVSAAFSDAFIIDNGQVFVKMNIGVAKEDPGLNEKLRKLMGDCAREAIRESLRPGGLLNGR